MPCRRYQVYHGADPGQDNPQITAAAAMPAQQWVFVLLVQAGGTATLVLDTGRGPVVAAQGPVEPPRRLLRSSNLVGQSNWAGDAMFRGRVRGLAVWDRALDRAEWAAYASWSFETGTVPVSGLLSLCRQPSPPPPPVPAPAIRVNASQPAAVVPAELLGLDLEFTRHDIWEVGEAGNESLPPSPLLNGAFILRRLDCHRDAMPTPHRRIIVGPTFADLFCLATFHPSPDAVCCRLPRA